jgi:hypothetical protein
MDCTKGEERTAFIVHPRSSAEGSFNCSTLRSVSPLSMASQERSDAAVGPAFAGISTPPLPEESEGHGDGPTMIASRRNSGVRPTLKPKQTLESIG